MRRLPNKWDSYVGAFIFLMAFAASGRGDIISVPNFSFESPDITTDGAFTATSATGDTTAVPNWTATFTAGNSSLRAGVQEAAGTEYPGAAGNNAPLPLPAQGGQYAYLNLDSSTGSSSSLTTTTPVTVSGGVTYSLTVAIGRRLDAIPYNVTIALLVDGNVAATASTTGQSLVSGAFVDLATSLTITSNSPFVGGQLAIRLTHSCPGSGSGGFYQANFDNVRLTVTPASSTPSPTASATATPTPTAQPTPPVTPTATPIRSATPTPTATSTPSPVVSFALPNLEKAGDIGNVVAQSTGKIIVFGQFSRVNGDIYSNAVRLNSDGSVDKSFPSLDFARPTENVVDSIVLSNDSFILVLYDLTDDSYQLKRFTSNGEPDPTFQASLPSSIYYRQLIPFSDGKTLLVVEDGLNSDQTVFIRLNVDGTADSGFNPSFGSINPATIESKPVIVQPDGQVVFSYYYGSGHIARLSANFDLDPSFSPSPGQSVICLGAQLDGRILVGGFNPVLVRLNFDGSVDKTFNAQLTNPVLQSPEVANLWLQQDRKILAAINEYGYPATLVRFNSDGSQDASFAPFALSGVERSYVAELDAQDSVLLRVTAGLPGDVQRLIRLNNTGEPDGSFKPTFTSSGGNVSNLIHSAHGIVVTGDFSTVNGFRYPNLFKMGLDGSLDQTFPPLELNGNIKVSAGQSDGKIVVAGDFTTANGLSISNGLARLSIDGSLDQSFHSNAGSAPQSLLAQNDGKLLLAWNFPSAFTPPNIPYLVRLNSDGTIDNSFPTFVTPGPGSGVGVTALAQAPDGKLLYARNSYPYARYPGQNTSTWSLTRFDGTAEQTVISERFSAETHASVHSIAIQSDGGLFLGGVLPTCGGFPAGNIVHINPDSTLDTAFQANAQVNASIQTILAQDDGGAIIGGNFTAVSGVPAAGIAKLTSDGYLDYLFTPDSVRGSINALLSLPNGIILAGGSNGLTLVSITSPNSDDTISTNSVTPISSLVIASKIQTVHEVHFFVNEDLVDVQTVPLATNGFVGPGHADNSGQPGYDSAVYSSDKFVPPQEGTYTLRVDVLDSDDNVISSTETTVTAVDPTQAPPPQTFDIGGLANGTAYLTGSDVKIIAGPKTTGTGLKKLELLVNGTVAQHIDIGPTFNAGAAATLPDASGSYTFIFIPKAPGTFGLRIRATGAANVTTTSNTIAITAGPSSRLLNISTRLFVDNGDNVLIGGTIVTGTGQKKVLIRAIGPSLGAAGVLGALPDPTLELRDGNGGLMANNDDWGDSPDKQAIIDTTIPPSHPKESAILATLPASTNGINYTAIVRGANGSTGIGLVEVYDLDGNVSSTKLANISTRGKVLSGDNAMIGGFILGGKAGAAPDTVIVRGIGPSLPFSGVLQDPTLELHQGPTTIASNDDWKENEAEVTATTIPPVNDRESAIVRTLQPLTGMTATATISTTAIVRGKNDGTGIALVEVYDLNK